jgi:hypothetical protein
MATGAMGTTELAGGLDAPIIYFDHIPGVAMTLPRNDGFTITLSTDVHTHFEGVQVQATTIVTGVLKCSRGSLEKLKQAIDQLLLASAPPANTD